MAGHSKWKNIRIRKGKQDAIRGNLFTKLSRELTVAAKSGGGDPTMNPRLRVAVDKAKEASMPKDNIDRAIKKGTGEIEGVNYEEIVYEGTGPGGIGIILQCYSENRNRTVGEVRNAFNKNGGSMADNGAVSWQFKYVGQIQFPKDGTDEDELTLAALEAGAEDVQSEEDVITIVTAMSDLHKVNEALRAGGYDSNEVGLTYMATNKAEPSMDDLRKLIKLLDALEELDDVQETFVNVDIPEELFEEA
ncbi:MAG: YebC/PmpR family DNA-binding transcriptional regulator [Armatimonadetes bacterium]|nr:YebC/PmpR family DNA-binding transcriptional regulator [Armatimonadota bacterium]MBS1703866.1 YebC/PmpR family DNA-binding transcriptional regulator [Armatimonadota bacterium]MBS1726243.1 YebC/PmpR family DNA-binding transcriptional regulator [Armatimonadota bacterium]